MPAPSPETWKPKLPLKFPRQFRPEWQIRYPNFREDGDLTSKLYWAGREASNRWKEAMDEPSRNLSATTVTPTDFIVAVFDKAAEMNESVQDQLFWQDAYIPSPEKWQRYTKKLITIARRQALKQIGAQFPNASQKDIDDRTASLESVMKFASGAMDCMWSARDSDGGRIEIRPFNSGIIKRYLPDRTKLSPRPFTRIDPDGTEVVMWLGYDYNVVPAPRGSSSSDKTTSSKSMVDKHPGQLSDGDDEPVPPSDLTHDTAVATGLDTKQSPYAKVTKAMGTVCKKTSQKLRQTFRPSGLFPARGKGPNAPTHTERCGACGRWSAAAECGTRVSE